MDLLDVVIDYDCNLKCDYCTITDQMRLRGLGAPAIAKEIDQAAQAGTTALSFTGGEPTIRNDLLPLIRRARDRGFTDIKIQTNGLLFAHPANVEMAIEAGVTRVHVSVHGHDGAGPEKYERITEGPEGTHAMMLQAIDNLVQSPLHFEVDLIMMQSTYETLPEAVVELASRGVTHFNLWLVSLTDKNAANPQSLVRIEALRPFMTQCFEYARAHDLTVRSFHVPRCLLPGYEDHVSHPGAGMDVRVITPDSSFQLSASRLSGGHKPERCGECKWDAKCPGLRTDYVDKFGDEAISPVR